jgi:excisionase family DNA binding protein
MNGNTVNVSVVKGRLGLTVSQAANELGVSENTVRRWADAGHLRAFRTPGGQRRFSEKAVEDFMRIASEGAPARVSAA